MKRFELFPVQSLILHRYAFFGSSHVDFYTNLVQSLAHRFVYFFYYQPIGVRDWTEGSNHNGLIAVRDWTEGSNDPSTLPNANLSHPSIIL